MADELQIVAKRSPLRRLTGVQIVGTGSFLPDNVVTNEALASLGCDAEWIIQRTGIRERRHAPPEMCTSDMAVEAAERCIASADIDRRDIDMLVLGTLSPDYLLPATATTVQDRLGLNCAAMDVSAACAGFMYAMVTGMQFVATGASKCALVIGADTNSRVMNPADKKTYPLFGDGAGAVLVTKGSSEQGLLSYTLGADGSGDRLLVRPVGGTREPLDPNGGGGDLFVKMDGRPVFKCGCWKILRCRCLRRAGTASTTWASGCFTRPTSAFSTRRPTRWASIARRSSRISTATATRRPAACRSRSMNRCAPAGLAAAICC